MKWCGAINLHIQDFFLFSAHIAENWKVKEVEELNLAKVASDLSDCVKYTMSLFRPDKMGPTRDFKQPAWLTERRAKKSLQMAKCNSENTPVAVTVFPVLKSCSSCYRSCRTGELCHSCMTVSAAVPNLVQL